MIIKHKFILLAIIIFSVISIVSANDTDVETVKDEPAQMNINRDLLHDRWYKRVLGTLTVYDAPNGNHIRTLDEGFNYVTALSEIDGWTEINRGEWVLTEQLQDTNSIISNFTGIFLPTELPEYTYAWSLVNQYPSDTAGASPNESLDMIYRYKLLQIQEIAIVDDIRWYRVGENQWVHQYRVAKVQPLTEIPADVNTDIWVGIDLYEQVLIAYEGSTPIFATLISSGLPRWPTYEGVFNIYYRVQRKYMSWGQVGDDFYALEEVPWTMFFDEGRALHGAYWHDGFGYRRSHGCVNLSITDAKWLYDWVSTDLASSASSDIEEGPNVYVYSTDIYTID